MEYLPEVVQAIPGKGYSVYAYFSDGGVRLVDVSKLIEQGGVFAPLKDKRKFDECLTVMNGAIAWDSKGTRDPKSCIDIDPIRSYEDFPLVKDPLSQVKAEHDLKNG